MIESRIVLNALDIMKIAANAGFKELSPPGDYANFDTYLEARDAFTRFAKVMAMQEAAAEAGPAPQSDDEPSAAPVPDDLDALTIENDDPLVQAYGIP